MKPSPFDSHSRSHTRQLNANMNVVPYIDVMLVLLVIFMVTTPMLTTGVEVDLPKAKADSLATGTQMPVIVSLLNDGSLTLSSEAADNEPISQEALVNTLLQLQNEAGEDEPVKVMINADKDNSYGLIMQLMTALQQAGINKVGLLTDMPLPENNISVSE